MTAAAELLDLSQNALWHGYVVFLRVGAAISLLPAFGERSVPIRIKLGLALAFTLVVAPAVPEVPFPLNALVTARLSITEAISGLAIGFGVRLFILALQVAGSIAAQSTSLSQILGGAAADPMPAMGYVLVIGGLALAVMTGLHVKAAELLIRSYELLPMGEFPDARTLSGWGLQRVVSAFALAFTLSAPFVIASIIYNLTLGVINKAMPQLMVAFVGAPVITFGGLFLLAVVAPILLSVWASALDGFLINPFGSPQ